MKQILISILVCIPYFLVAQLHDTLQRILLKEHGIRKIEKVEVVRNNDSIQYKLFSKEVVNKDGYIISIKSFDEKEKLSISYDHNYSDNNLLLESIVVYNKLPLVKKLRTVYTYNGSKFPETFSYYENYELLTIQEYTYNKAMKIKKAKQVWYNKKGKKTGKGKSVFKYDESGNLSKRIDQSTMNGIDEKITYTYKYDTTLNTKETYSKRNDEPNDFIMERKIMDCKDRLIDEFSYYGVKIQYSIQGRSFELKEGDSLHKNYQYNSLGLIEIATFTASDNQRLELVYKYSQ